VITEFDLLKARHRHLIEERHRERIFRLRRVTGGGGISVPVSAAASIDGPADGARSPDPARS
jgi:hypothetical protein